MRKIKNLSLFILALLVAITANIAIKTTGFSYADSPPEKLYFYTISNNADKIKIVGKNSDESTYILNDSLTQTNSLFEEISTDLSSSDTVPTLYFDDFTAFENIEITSNKLVLSGTINLSNFSINYTPAENNSTLTLNNLSLNSTNKTQIIVDGTNSLSINIEDCNFSSTKQDSFALFFKNTNANLTVDKAITHTTTYLFNCESSLNVSLKGDIDLSDQPNEKLAFTIPYYIDNTVAIRNCEIALEKLNICPLYDYYETGALLKNINFLYTYSNIKYNFDSNGGSLDNNVLKIPYSSKTTHFPNEDDISKEHFDFLGWIGKLTLSQETMTLYAIDNSTWYFDKTSLASFITNNYDYANISSYFSTSIPDQENLSYFDSYSFDSTSTNLDFLATKLFISQNQAPTFVADWTNSTYTLIFDSDGGTEIESISGLYNSAISLTDSSKIGYTFLGWFDKDDKQFTKTTMPDENITLKAKWQALKYNLTIDPNNDEQPTKIIVDFATTLSTLTELNATSYTKIGYTFIGWFDINDITYETMPNTELTLVAKWTINQYTINYYYNHQTNSSVYKTITADYNTLIEPFADPTIAGYNFTGWYRDPENSNSINLTKIPAEDINVYAGWSTVFYDLIYYCNNQEFFANRTIKYNDQIADIQPPAISGYKFNGWYEDTSFNTPFTRSIMPNHDLKIYAKLIEKNAINIQKTPQKYEKDNVSGYILDSSISGISITYYVNNTWTTKVPTEIGIYDVRLVRSEDDSYKQLYVIIEGGLEITQNITDIEWINYILFAIFGIEMLIALIVIIIKKQKLSYVSLSIAFPFAVIETNQFIRFVVALVLAIFGFVLIIVELVKLHNISLDQKEFDQDKENQKRLNNMNNINEEKIRNNVDDLLKKNFQNYDNEK